jgi:entericidin B
MKKLLIITALLAFSTSLVACNTMEGLGQDIQHGGENLENSADKNK